MVSYFKLVKNILTSNIRRVSFPYKLTFAITYMCNYKCKTCNIWQRKTKDELTLEEITKFFRKSKKFKWIDFTGGEVWLRKDFVNIVEAAITHCKDLIMLHFPTNGYMTEKIVHGVEQIVKMRPRKLVITVSTDGDEAVNDYVRGMNGGWRRQIETYKKLHAIPGVRVVLGITISSYNVDQYDKAFAAAKAECPWLKPTDFHMNIAHESSHYYDNMEKGVLNQDLNQLVKQVNRYKALRGISLNPIDVIERIYLKNIEKYLYTGITPMRCHALYSSCFIGPYGTIYPCGMYNKEIANLRDHDFDLKEIWDLVSTRQLQNDIWEYKCPQCWTPCEAYQSIFGNLFGLKNTSCNRRNIRMEDSISLTSKLLKSVDK